MDFNNNWDHSTDRYYHVHSTRKEGNNLATAKIFEKINDQSSSYKKYETILMVVSERWQKKIYFLFLAMIKWYDFILKKLRILPILRNNPQNWGHTKHTYSY